MANPQLPRPPRPPLWAPVIFLVLFLALVGLVANYWLIPMMQLVKQGTPEQHTRAVAYGTLVLVLLLFLLLVGLMASFRLSSWFFRNTDRSQPTDYIDIWKEAGRRTASPDAKDLEDPDKQS